MITPFFRIAMTAPARQTAFRRMAIGHVLFVSALVAAALAQPTAGRMQALGYGLLAGAMVEGAILIGWRMAQLPKSQALEFLLVSPLHARRIFVGELAVGLVRFLWVQLAGVPALLGLVLRGLAAPADVAMLLALPLIGGLTASLALIVWAYETRLAKRVGEAFAGFGILAYLVIGVLAGERLRDWLGLLPTPVADLFFQLFWVFHRYNPFGVIEFWFDPINGVPVVALERAMLVGQVGLATSALLALRAMSRLKGHFHDRHYRPITSDRASLTERIGDRPLSWWAVRRVMEYSGRVNIWLAGGFGCLYAAYLVLGDSWPAWMGRAVFQIFEGMGGAPALTTGLVILSAVPAAFQYGLWDHSAQDRGRRLELLLLTELDGRDYWHAALAAAWRRGRGYMIVAIILWGAMAVAGRINPLQLAASAAAAAVLWGFSFAVGFRAFSRGRQANGLGSLLTLGLPLLTAGLMKAGLPGLAALLPPGAIYVALAEPLSATWVVGPLALGVATIWLSRTVITRCEAGLRQWFDGNNAPRPTLQPVA